MLNDELAKRLLARRPALDRLAAGYRRVEDVLAGEDRLRTAEYLPQHGAEHADDYKRRLKLTPIFRETPAILESRQGALFRKRAEITLPERLQYLFARARLSGGDLYDCIVAAADAAQVYGLCAILLDRERLPARAPDAPPLTQAEADARGMGRVYLALYPASQILDWAHDGTGLAWIRLVETVQRAATWDAPPQNVDVVRVVTRDEILCYEISKRPDGMLDVNTLEPVRHGARDDAGQPAVPVRLIQPFPGRDGLGRPVLAGAAEADAAALWVLSELCWFAYMASPLLTLTTDKDESEIGKVPLGASRFIALAAKQSQDGTDEKLAFVPYDIGPMTQLAALHQTFIARARDASGKTGAAALPMATEQSGVSKAWTFKTGEERILFLLAHHLEQSFQWLLELADRMSRPESGVRSPEAQAPTPATIKFPETFDVAGPQETFDAAAQAAEFFRGLGINEAVVQLVLRAAEAAIPNASEESWKLIEAEALALREQDLRGAALDAAPAGDGGQATSDGGQT